MLGCGAKVNLTSLARVWQSRVGVCLTLVLALNVFQLILNDNMPKTVPRPNGPSHAQHSVNAKTTLIPPAVTVHRANVAAAAPPAPPLIQCSH